MEGDRYPESGAQRTNGENPWRATWGEVAPSAQNMPRLDGTSNQNPNVNGGNGQNPWRAGYGEVAPAAQNMPRLDGTNNGDPNVNGGNGQNPWRATPGVAPGYPGGDRGGSNPQPQPGNGGMDWNEYARRQIENGNNPNGNSPFRQTPQDGGVNGSGSGVVVDEQRRKYIADSLKLQTNVLSFLWTGGLTGAGMNAGMWALDRKLLATPEAERGAMLNWWNKYSPAQKLLTNENAAVATAKAEFAQANTLFKNAELSLKGVETIPNTMNAAADASLKALGAPSAKLPQWEAQKAFLDGLGAIKDGDLITAQLGTRAEVNAGTKLFEQTSKLGKDLNLYATGLKTGGTVDPKVFAPQIAQLEGKLAKEATTQTQRTLLDAQIQFLKSGKTATLETVNAAIGTAAEVGTAGSGKLFVAGTPEAAQLLDFATKSEAHAGAISALDTARSAQQLKEAALKQAQELGADAAHGSLLGTSVRGLGKGLLVSAGTLGAGYAADMLGSKIFGYGAPDSNGVGRFVMDGVITPAILLSSWEPRYKFTAAAATFIGARAMDYMTGTGASADMSMLLRPNWVDAAGVTASVLAPLPGKYKAIGVLGALAAGRGWNLLSRVTGLDGGSPAQLDSDTKNLLNRDSVAKTESSFLRTANKAKELGVENEAALELQLVDALNRTVPPTAPASVKADYDRTVAALSYGLGMSRMEKGSRLDQSTHGTDSRFLVGTNYDMGSDAAMELRRAAGMLYDASSISADPAYKQQLDSLRGKVEEQLNVIYGEHKNFESTIYNEVKSQCRKDLQGMMKYIVSSKQILQTLNTNDARYVAKMNRDIALANLAYADYISGENNGSDAASFMAEADARIREAQRLEANSADAKELARIADRVRTKVRPAINNQWNNTTNNPFGVR